MKYVQTQHCLKETVINYKGRKEKKKEEIIIKKKITRDDDSVDSQTRKNNEVEEGKYGMN